MQVAHKGHLSHTHSNILLNAENRKDIFSEIRSRQRIHTLATFTRHSTGSSNQSNSVRKRSGKDDVKLPFCTSHVTLYVEYPKDAAQTFYYEETN